MEVACSARHDPQCLTSVGNITVIERACLVETSGLCRKSAALSAHRTEIAIAGSSARGWTGTRAAPLFIGSVSSYTISTVSPCGMGTCALNIGWPSSLLLNTKPDLPFIVDFLSSAPELPRARRQQGSYPLVRRSDCRTSPQHSWCGRRQGGCS